MTQLADVLRISPARLGNHLARLREVGLVEVERTGRHATYRSAGGNLMRLLDELAGFAGGALPVPAGPAQSTRLCYDHAAGALGVGLLDVLLQRDAVRPVPDSAGAFELGEAAEPVLADFGLELSAIQKGRRVFVAPCLDRTIRRPHLGGGLGAHLLAALVNRQLVERTGDGIQIVEGRRRELERLIPPLQAA
jgi:DNA-binding transcriptional ArsR family regulator